MEWISAHRLLRIENTTNLRTNAIPQTILTKFMISRNNTKPHQKMIGLRPIGRDEFVGGCPVDEFGTIASGTGIVKAGLKLGDIMGRDLHRGGIRGSVTVQPETVFVGVRTAAIRAQGAVLVSLIGEGYAPPVRCLRQDMSI